MKAFLRHEVFFTSWSLLRYIVLLLSYRLVVTHFLWRIFDSVDCREYLGSYPNWRMQHVWWHALACVWLVTLRVHDIYKQNQSKTQEHTTRQHLGLCGVIITVGYVWILLVNLLWVLGPRGASCVWYGAISDFSWILWPVNHFGRDNFNLEHVCEWTSGYST